MHKFIIISVVKEKSIGQAVILKQLTGTNPSKIALTPSLPKASNRPLIRIKKSFNNIEKKNFKSSQTKSSLIGKTIKLDNSLKKTLNP